MLRICSVLGNFAAGALFAVAAGATEAPRQDLRVAMLSAAGAETPAGMLWFDEQGGAARAVALLRMLERAESHGLPPRRYDVDALRRALAATRARPETVGAADEAFTQAYVTYAGDLAAGVLSPSRIDPELHIFPERPDPTFLRLRAGRIGDVGALLDGLAPVDPQYQRLRDELARLDGLRAQGGWGPPAETGGLLRRDDSGDRVMSLRRRLNALGESAGAGALFDETLEQAVRAFQRRHGLNDDGVVGPRTYSALNATVEDRRAQVLVNLERLRWRGRERERRYILVNQADFTVRLIDDGATLFRERVIIGKARRFRTPEFSDRMTYLVLNPYWNVPRSIATKELLPELIANPAYLTEENMELLPANGGAAPPADQIDWRRFSRNYFPFDIRQRPGPGNALGQVKFMFPKDFSIYLHDTPAKSLFDRDARAFSHGCVRVRDPLTLAEALLAPQEEDPAAFLAELLAEPKPAPAYDAAPSQTAEDAPPPALKERIVRLKQPVMVHLVYHTAWVGDDGRPQYREDIYGRDARVLAALHAVGVDAAAD